jgi:hypothetical protein
MDFNFQQASAHECPSGNAGADAVTIEASAPALAPVRCEAPCGAQRLSELAIAKLHSSGIPPEPAVEAGIYSVENAKEQVHEEFAVVPALVIPYFDIQRKPIFFERNGEFLQFIRLRYLAEPPAQNFIQRRPLRYVQYKDSGVYAYFARLPCYDWSAIAANPTVAIAFVEGELKALKACTEDLPTVGIAGVDCFLRKREEADQ